MRRTERSKLDLAKFGLAVLATVVAGAVGTAAFAQDAQSTQQDQPSVADVARAAAAAKKDKDKAAAPKHVITDDSLGSISVSSNAAGGSGAAGGAVPGTPAGDAAGAGMNSASLDAAWARLQITEASLDKLEPLGKSEVATTVLGGNTSDFPGRADWEEKLYAEKTAYCARSRQLIAAMKEMLLRMAAMNSGDQKVSSSNDPRVVSLTRKTTQLMQLAAKTETEFQGVVMEGRQLAAQAGK